jgi:hypothetical protein
VAVALPGSSKNLRKGLKENKYQARRSFSFSFETGENVSENRFA